MDMDLPSMVVLYHESQQNGKIIIISTTEVELISLDVDGKEVK